MNSPFYISLISPQLIPFDVLNKCTKQGNTRSQHLSHLYPDYQGQPNLRHVLSKHFSDNYFSLNANKLTITNGCIDAVKTAIEVTTKPGDAIAISSPCFNGLIELLASLDRKVIEFPCFDAQLDLIQLEQHLKGKSVKACLFSTLDLYKDCLRINIGWAITGIPKSNTANNPNSMRCKQLATLCHLVVQKITRDF